VPRNRTVRLAVLGSSVQRAAAAKYPSRARTALKRRVVAAVLVLLSLVMITLSFRAGEEGGGLANLQAAAATGVRPFQVGVERVVRPFRDLHAYVSGLVDAKGEADRLRAENRLLRQEVIRNQQAVAENARLRRLYSFRAPPAYRDFDTIGAAVIGYPPSRFIQHLDIAAGWAEGVRVNDPVVNGDGLVGRVTKVADRTAQVTLLTDEKSAVSAAVLDRKAAGIVRRERAGSDLLLLDQVDKRFRVRKGDRVVTAGSQRGETLRSLYPRGIPIGSVDFVGQTDIDPFKRVQVDPYVDFASIDSVLVLVPRRTER
jgi:rod shape-determining protein MreC